MLFNLIRYTIRAMNRLLNLFRGGEKSEALAIYLPIEPQYPGKFFFPNDTIDPLIVEEKKRRMNPESDFVGIQRFFYNETQRFIAPELVDLLNLGSVNWFFLYLPGIDQQFYRTGIFAGFDEEIAHQWNKDHSLDLSSARALVQLNRAHSNHRFGVHSAVVGGYTSEGRPLAVQFDNWSTQATDMAFGMNGESIEGIEGAISHFNLQPSQDTVTHTSRIVTDLIQHNKSAVHYPNVFRMTFEQRIGQATYYPHTPMLQVALHNHTSSSLLQIPQSLSL